MNDLPKFYFTMEQYLFPMLEEELGELTAKMNELLRIMELVRPSRFINNALRWCELGRPMKDRGKMLRAFFLKAVYDLPTTKGLIRVIADFAAGNIALKCHPRQHFAVRLTCLQRKKFLMPFMR